MSIQEEVQARKIHWLPFASFNEGRYVIQPFECSVTGKDKGYAPVKASAHNGELSLPLLRILTVYSSILISLNLTVDPLGIWLTLKWLAMAMLSLKAIREYNFPVRNFDTFYKQVYPFNPFYFSTKLHPTGGTSLDPAPLTTYVAATHHSPCSAKKPLPLVSTIPRYWLEMMAPQDCRTATAGNLTRQSDGLRFVALSLSLTRWKKNLVQQELRI